MQITVTEIGEAEKSTKGKNSWYTLPVKYTNDRGQEGGKKFVSFEKVWPEAKTLEVGKTYDVKVTKEGSNWVWQSINEIQGGATPSGGTSRPAPLSNSAGRDWETKEERAIRQKMIVAQSCLGYALEFHKLHEEKPSREELLDTAQFFADHVLGNNTPEAEVD
jgi:hypothetical protein